MYLAYLFQAGVAKSWNVPLSASSEPSNCNTSEHCEALRERESRSRARNSAPWLSGSTWCWLNIFFPYKVYPVASKQDLKSFRLAYTFVHFTLEEGHNYQNCVCNKKYIRQCIVFTNIPEFNWNEIGPKDVIFPNKFTSPQSTFSYGFSLLISTFRGKFYFRRH